MWTPHPQHSQGNITVLFYSKTTRKIKTKTGRKVMPESLFYSSKTLPCAVISGQISSKFTGEAVCYLLCISPLSFLVLLSRILGEGEVSNNRVLDHSTERLSTLWLLWFLCFFLKKKMLQAGSSAKVNGKFMRIFTRSPECCIFGSIRIYILMTGRLEVVSNETN